MFSFTFFTLIAASQLSGSTRDWDESDSSRYLALVTVVTLRLGVIIADGVVESNS